MKRFTFALLAPLVTALATPGARAQQPAAAAAELAVGADAPDFTLPGATRYGVLKGPVHLSDFKGKTVVLAFFYKARTKG
jgi:peroxiredoxin Q/BCP